MRSRRRGTPSTSTSPRWPSTPGPCSRTPAPPSSSLRPTPARGDPQTLPRLSLSGVALALVPGTPEYEAGRAALVGRFPDAAERFALADFVLFRFEPSEARWVGGFARALRMTGAQLAEALRDARDR
jgi:hypothetical protein